MKKFSTFSITAILLAATFSLAGAQTTWKIDPAHTNVGFAVDYMVLTQVDGKFTDVSGTLSEQGTDVTKSTVTVGIKTASITTDNEKRDNHLRSADFFDAQKYPEITFVSKSFTKKDDNAYDIAGDLTMHGVTKPVVINAVYSGQAKDPWGNQRKGFRGKLSINRSEFGVKYNAALETGGVLIGDKVDVTLNVQFVQQKEDAGTK